MAAPKNPALPKLRDWPMFRAPAGTRPKVADDGQAPPKISELIMQRVPGLAAQKLAWLREQVASGKLDGDDPDEVAQAEALLLMLLRLSGSRAEKADRHLDEILDEGLRETSPASDPVSVGHFTATNPPSRPVDTTTVEAAGSAKTRSRLTQTRRKRAA